MHAATASQLQNGNKLRDEPSKLTASAGRSRRVSRSGGVSRIPRALRVFRDERLPERDPRVFALSLGVAERVHQRVARERRRERARRPRTGGRRQEPHDAGGVDDAAPAEPRRVRFASREQRRVLRYGRGRRFVVVVHVHLVLFHRRRRSRPVVRPAPQVRGHLREAQERLVVDGVAPAGAHRARVAERARRQVRQDLLLQWHGELIREAALLGVAAAAVRGGRERAEDGALTTLLPRLLLLHLLRLLPLHVGAPGVLVRLGPRRVWLGRVGGLEPPPLRRGLRLSGGSAGGLRGAARAGSEERRGLGRRVALLGRAVQISLRGGCHHFGLAHLPILLLLPRVRAHERGRGGEPARTTES